MWIARKNVKLDGIKKKEDGLRELLLGMRSPRPSLEVSSTSSEITFYGSYKKNVLEETEITFRKFISI